MHSCPQANFGLECDVWHPMRSSMLTQRAGLADMPGAAKRAPAVSEKRSLKGNDLGTHAGAAGPRRSAARWRGCARTRSCWWAPTPSRSTRAWRPPLRRLTPRRRCTTKPARRTIARRARPHASERPIALGAAFSAQEQRAKCVHPRFHCNILGSARASAQKNMTASRTASIDTVLMCLQMSLALILELDMQQGNAGQC